MIKMKRFYLNMWASLAVALILALITAASL